MLNNKVSALLAVFLLSITIPSIARAQTAVGEMMCACPGLSKPKGNAATCEEACNGQRSSGGASNDDAARALGTALGQQLGKALGQWLRGNPERQAELAQRIRELDRRQQEEARLRREAESRNREEIFSRLNGELKVAGLPGLHLKGIERSQELRLKGLDQTASGTGELKLKLGDDATRPYGIPGLPGVYTGGPRPTGSNAGGGATGEKTDKPLALKLGDEGSTPAPINGNSEAAGVPASGAGTRGIPGLPGIYLNGPQQTSAGIQQAKQLALSAESLSGTERELAEGAALNAAAGDPALMASSDESANAFKQANQEYEQARDVQARASEAFSEAQRHHEAASEVLEVAETQFQKEKAAGLDPAALERRQQDFSQLVASAKSDEVAWQNAKQQFDSATADVSLKRSKAIQALRGSAIGAPTNAVSSGVPDMPEIPTVLQEDVRASLIAKRQPLALRKQALIEEGTALNKSCDNLEKGSSEHQSCLAKQTQFNSQVQPLSVEMGKLADEIDAAVRTYTIKSMNALAKQLGWSEDERTRLDTALNSLASDGDQNVTSAQIIQAWADVLARGQDRDLAREAAQGEGPGFPAAGQQSRYRDCTIFALATAAGLPYGVAAARATELIRQGEWRGAAERANPQRVIEQKGLIGGEVVMLAEAFGQAEVVLSADFARTLRGGRPVLVNVVPQDGNVDGGHEVVLTKAFQHGGDIWYEMMDSNQGPQRRLYLSAKELNTILQENGVAFRPEPRTPPKHLP